MKTSAQLGLCRISGYDPVSGAFSNIRYLAGYWIATGETIFGLHFRFFVTSPLSFKPISTVQPIFVFHAKCLYEILLLYRFAVN